MKRLNLKKICTIGIGLGSLFLLQSCDTGGSGDTSVSSSNAASSLPSPYINPVPNTPSPAPAPLPNPAPAPSAYPAVHAALPTVIDSGGSILSNPSFLNITFSGDSMAQSLEQFASNFASSAEWTSMVSEYGVGRATNLSAVRLNETPASSLTDTQIQSWLKNKINSASRPLGSTVRQTIYILNYPQATSINASGSMSCTDFAGYHSSFRNTDGSLVVYAVIARCAGYTIQDQTETISHELVESAVDPDVDNAAYLGVSNDYAIWETLSGGSETGDLCSLFASSYFTPADIGFAVQRTWSNAAAAAGQNPCSPNSAVYYNAAPVLPDSVSYFDASYGQTRYTRGVSIAVGQSKTIELDLFSSAATGAWQLSAFEDGHGSDLSFQFSKTSGVNGDKIQLTIHVNAKNNTYKAEPFWIKSTLNGTSYYWPVVVGN